MTNAEWQSLARPDLTNGLPIISAGASDRSASADEVENMIGGKRQINRQMLRPMHVSGQYSNRISGQSSSGFMYAYPPRDCTDHDSYILVPMQQNMRRVKGFRPSLMG